MANVQHSSLTGADLHEPKGVASASAGDVYTANGSNSGTWEIPYTTKYPITLYIPYRGNFNTPLENYCRMYIPFAGTITHVAYNIWFPSTSVQATTFYLYNGASPSSVITSASGSASSQGTYGVNTSLTNDTVTAGTYLTLQQVVTTGTDVCHSGQFTVWITQDAV